MTDADPNTTLLLGELRGQLRGQLREIIHNMNNRATENANISRQLAKLEQVPDRLAAIENRLNALETDKHRRDGAMGFGAWLLRSPLVGWLVGLVMLVWGYAKGIFQ